ncbi:glutamate racemase [PVC group bacterium (ex Bugula neritina AB1)]|nr:glutamate racemase [PVC group bacterium (ex Bugula neritina AB1)]
MRNSHLFSEELLLKKRPKIGVFDSGMGGFSVLKSLIKKSPYCDFVYIGDTANFPYGMKSKEQIISCTHNAVNFLLKKDVESVIIGCHTASIFTMNQMEKSFSIPLFFMVPAACLEALRVSKKRVIAVIGTKATVQSDEYSRYLKSYDRNIHVKSRDCPLLIEFAERGSIDIPLVRKVVKNYLEDFVTSEVDTLILGCTHFSIFRDLIRQEVGEHVNLVDPVYSVSDEIVNKYGIQSLDDRFSLDVYVTNGDLEYYLDRVYKLFVGMEVDLKIKKIILDEKNVYQYT